MLCKILPPSAFILQGSSVFWSSSDQVNYLGYTTRKNRLKEPQIISWISFKILRNKNKTYEKFAPRYII